MNTAESRRGRRILGRLPRGSDLFESLRAICRDYKVRSGEFRGGGALETADLCAYDQAARAWGPPRAFRAGGLELLHLTGNIAESERQLAVVAQATLMRERDSGLEVLGGHLVAARVFHVELIIESFDDIVLRRGADFATGLEVWKEAALADEETLEESPLSRRPLSMGDTIPPGELGALLAGQAAPPGRGMEAGLSAGDVIVHPKFARCVVERVESSGEFVQVRLGNGRMIRLNLEVISLTPQGTEHGQRVFSATIG